MNLWICEIVKLWLWKSTISQHNTIWFFEHASQSQHNTIYFHGPSQFHKLWEIVKSVKNTIFVSRIWPILKFFGIFLKKYLPERAIKNFKTTYIIFWDFQKSKWKNHNFTNITNYEPQFHNFQNLWNCDHHNFTTQHNFVFGSGQNFTTQHNFVSRLFYNSA